MPPKKRDMGKQAEGILPDSGQISRDKALAKAKAFLRAQAWGHECDEESAQVIESNECINILFPYKRPRKPQATIISVDKTGGAVTWIKLG
ncbi:hypothetical protein JW933_06535 [candidate division FCPU426 bacterium]|nr:hypothetical protein [candidate division FCPU426 bacterium]